jgi:hypothetical protein
MLCCCCGGIQCEAVPRPLGAVRPDPEEERAVLRPLGPHPVAVPGCPKGSGRERAQHSPGEVSPLSLSFLLSPGGFIFVCVDAHPGGTQPASRFWTRTCSTLCGRSTPAHFLILSSIVVFVGGSVGDENVPNTLREMYACSPAFFFVPLFSLCVLCVSGGADFLMRHVCDVVQAC